MDSNQQPPPMPVPFALNGQKTAIPQASQISVTRGAASFNDGFPPLTMTDPLAGGIPPFGRDMNGILFLLSLAIRWVQAGGSFCYDADFANDPDVGGYPQGAVLLNASLTGFWISTVDNNATNPDATDANDANAAQGWLSMNPDWNAMSGPGMILNRPDLAKVATTGDYNDLLDKPAIPPGYALPPATTTNLGGVIAGPGTTVAADGTLSASGILQTVCAQHPDSKGNCIVQAQNAAVITGKQVSLINQSGSTSGSILLKSLQPGTGMALADHGNTIEIDAANATVIVNLTPAANVALDLSPFASGTPEILFNLPVAGGATTTLSFVNAPASGVLAEFVLVVISSAGSSIVWPSRIKWPQGVAPSLTGVAGKLDTFVIYTQDGGATCCGFVAGQNQ